MFNEQKTDNLTLLFMALVAVIFHIALNGQYGFHRDELDFIMNARRLDWGYVSYPPITPFFARIGLEIFGESLRGLRVLPAIAQGAAMILAGLMARDMGGKRSAQILAAFTVFIAPMSLFGGTVIMYFAFDYLWWVLVAFFMVRLLATDDPRYWLGIGAGIGLGMMTKYTMAFFVVGLVVAVLVTPARKYLRTKWLYLGAALALLIFLPNLIWQIQHDFISLEYLASIHARDVSWGRGNDFLPEQLFLTTNSFSIPLWTVGLSLCLFSASMKRFRTLGWMFLVTFVLFLINQGRGYYTGPAYVMLMAAGCIWFESWFERLGGKKRQLGYGVLWTMQVLGGLIGVILMKPIGVINSTLWDFRSDVSGDLFVEMVGWEDLTRQVAEIYQAIPESEKPRTVILAGNYGEAGAIDLYGDEYGLPRMITGTNSMWYRGYGNPEPQTVIVVGFEGDYARHFFKLCEYSGTVTNSYNVQNEETTFHTGLYICREPRRPWSEMWQEMQWFQ
ncbi:MAG: phospholipid carrier-dependent glycosyltransferase [Chloroflexi bacterium]|nr:MAG: phospholipid carrier-dependent glycosyltransferase [Chloroflexota bacterium]